MCSAAGEHSDGDGMGIMAILYHRPSSQASRFSQLCINIKVRCLKGFCTYYTVQRSKLPLQTPANTLRSELVGSYSSSGPDSAVFLHLKGRGNSSEDSNIHTGTWHTSGDCNDPQSFNTQNLQKSFLNSPKKFNTRIPPSSVRML